jgi:hypothetical protein
MAYLGDTGQGGTLVLATTGAIGRIRSAQLPNWVMQAINADGLSDTGFMKKIPGDLADPGTISGTAVFAATEVPPSPGVVEEATITFPLGDVANDVAATLVGTGFLTDVGLPNMALETLMEIAYTFTFDGGTGPAFTPEEVTPINLASDAIGSIPLGSNVVSVHPYKAWNIVTRELVTVAQYRIKLDGRVIGYKAWRPGSALMLLERVSPIEQGRIEQAVKDIIADPAFRTVVTPDVTDAQLQAMADRDNGVESGDDIL